MNSDSSSSLEVPYALDLCSNHGDKNNKSNNNSSNNDNDDDDESSGISFESPGRQQGREPLRAGDVIAYTSPVFTAGAAYGRREATVVGVDPDHPNFPLVLDNCECLPWDTFVQRIGEFYKGTVRPHPGRQRPIAGFLLKASAGKSRTLLAATFQRKSMKYKGVLQTLEKDAMRAYAGASSNKRSQFQSRLFPTIPRRQSESFKGRKKSVDHAKCDGVVKSNRTQECKKRFLSDDSSSVSSIDRQTMKNAQQKRQKSPPMANKHRRHENKQHGRQSAATPSCRGLRLDLLDDSSSDCASDSSSVVISYLTKPLRISPAKERENPPKSASPESTSTKSTSQASTPSDSDDSSSSIRQTVKSPKIKEPTTKKNVSPTMLSFSKQNNHKPDFQRTKQHPLTSSTKEELLLGRQGVSISLDKPATNMLSNTIGHHPTTRCQEKLFTDSDTDSSVEVTRPGTILTTSAQKKVPRLIPKQDVRPSRVSRTHDATSVPTKFHSVCRGKDHSMLDNNTSQVTARNRHTMDMPDHFHSLSRKIQSKLQAEIEDMESESDDDDMLCMTRGNIHTSNARKECRIREQIHGSNKMNDPRSLNLSCRIAVSPYSTFNAKVASLRHDALRSDNSHKWLVNGESDWSPGKGRFRGQHIGNSKPGLESAISSERGLTKAKPVHHERPTSPLYLSSASKSRSQKSKDAHSNQKRKRDCLLESTSEDEGSTFFRPQTPTKKKKHTVSTSWSSDCEVDSPQCPPIRSHSRKTRLSLTDMKTSASSAGHVFAFVDEVSQIDTKRNISLSKAARKKRNIQVL